MLSYGQFLGYEKGEDGLPKIVEKEAKTVRLIYKMFLEGKTPTGIARYLAANKITTPSGKGLWHSSTVTSILKNEKYKGDAILQKTYTLNFLTKKKKINEGEVPQYYVENSHPAIVSPETFELVQEEFRRRKSTGTYTSAINCFASRIVCGDCGGFYGRKVWHSTTKYANTVWQCNKKFRKKEFCTTPHLKEEILKRTFIDAFNNIIENKAAILTNYEEIILKITDFKALERHCDKIDKECTTITEALEEIISENARHLIDQKEYNKKYAAFAARYNNLQKQRHEQSIEIAVRKGKYSQMKAFINELKKQDKLLTEFDESLWSATVNAVVVKSDKEVIFQFKDGTEQPWVIYGV